MARLVLSDVTVRYRHGPAPALRSADLEAGRGDWVGLIGANGAGKSSLLKAVAGTCRSEGSITIDGERLAARSRRQRAQAVAYVPQDPILPDEMTGLEYVMLGRSPHISYFGVASTHDRRVAVDCLQRLDLAGFADRSLSAMSGGERQRVVLARALATEASVLLLDEPTSALDIGHQQQALEIVDGLRRDHGLTVISAMHDLTLAGLYSDRLVLLADGAIVAQGAPHEVLTEATIATYYGAAVTVHRGDDGTLAVIARRCA